MFGLFPSAVMLPAMLPMQPLILPISPVFGSTACIRIPAWLLHLGHVSAGQLLMFVGEWLLVLSPFSLGPPYLHLSILIVLAQP